MPGQSNRDRIVYNHIWSQEKDRMPADTFVRMIETAMEQRDGQQEALTVADLGSGSGRHARYAAESGCCVAAVEYDDTAVARQFGIENRNWSVVHADVRNWLPTQPEKQFDAVVCFDALHHMAQDIERLTSVLGDIRRITRDGGFLLLTLLCELEYSAGAVPEDRLNLNEDQAHALFETSFTNDEILVKKSKPVFVESTLTADVDGQIVEAAYRSKRVLVLVRLEGGT